MNGIQQAAQAAATQAASAAAQAQSGTDNGNGGIPQATSIMDGSQTSNDVQTMLDAQPLPQNGEDVPTAQNGMLHDGIVNPNDDPAAAQSQPAETFNDARAMFLQSMQDMENDALNGIPDPIPQATINNVPVTTIETQNEPEPALNTYSNQEPPEFNYGHNLEPEIPPNASGLQMPNLDDIKQVIADTITANIANASQSANVEPEISEPEFDITSDEFYQKFTNNPGETIMDVATRIAERQIAANKAEMESRQQQLEEKMQPLLEESEKVRQRNASVEAMKQFLSKGEGRYNDFNDYSQQIAGIMRDEQMSLEDPRSFEAAYLMAKMPIMQQKLQDAEAQQGKTLSDYLNEDASVAEIIQNPTIQQQVINNYLRNLQNGSSPQVITNGSNAPIGTPPTKANNFKEASKFFESTLNNNL